MPHCAGPGAARSLAAAAVALAAGLAATAAGLAGTEPAGTGLSGAALDRTGLAGMGLAGMGLARTELAGTGWVGTGLAGAGMAGAPGGDAARRLRGGAIYAEACAGCHGARLQGGPAGTAPPLDATGHAWRHTRSELARIVADGSPGAVATPAMPGFGGRLGPVEIDAVLAYVAGQWPAGLRAWQAGLDPAGEATGPAADPAAGPAGHLAPGPARDPAGDPTDDPTLGDQAPAALLRDPERRLPGGCLPAPVSGGGR